jgi:asparagine synthase (glutamine-hydrolysing)
MFFCLYIGDQQQTRHWENKHSCYGAAFGFKSGSFDLQLGKKKVLALQYFHHSSLQLHPDIQQSDEHVLIATQGHSEVKPVKVKDDDIKAAMTKLEYSDEINIGWDKQLQQIFVTVPIGSPEQVYVYHDGDNIIISNDLRYYYLAYDVKLNEMGVLGLYQFGAVPAPYSLFQDISRISNGHIFSYELANNKINIKPLFQSKINLGIHNPQVLVENELKESLMNTPEDAILFFSGGVDSSVLAALAKESGKPKLPLICCSFGDDTFETIVSRDIARRLDLPLQLVEFNTDDLHLLLANCAHDYTNPLGDIALPAANLLARKASQLVNPGTTVIQGDGADALFAVGNKYTHKSIYYMFPKVMRAFGTKAYRGLGCWKWDSRPTKSVAKLARELEHIGALYQMSYEYPISIGAVACVNQLDNIAFYIPENIRKQFIVNFEQYVTNFLPEHDPRDEFSLLDTVHVVAGRTIVKTNDPLRNFGLQSYFPFQQSKMIQLALSIPWEEKCKDGVAKSILKDILCRYIPSNLVYRRKRGPIPPLKLILKSPVMQAYLYDVVLKNNNLAMDYTNKKIVLEMVDRVTQGKGVSWGSYQFLFTLILFSGWLKQLGEMKKEI